MYGYRMMKNQEIYSCLNIIHNFSKIENEFVKEVYLSPTVIEEK